MLIQIHIKYENIKGFSRSEMSVASLVTGF